MRTAHEVLVDIRALLTSRTRWAKGAAAYDLRNHEVAPESRHAVRWSLLGAMARSAPDEASYAQSRRVLLRALEASHPRTNLHRFNEMATHPELLAFLDEALRRSVEGNSAPR